MARDEDPYIYENSNVLKNKEGIRDADELERFERLMMTERQSQGLPDVPLTADGFRELHHHLFQDVFEWAGEIRTVDMAKNNDPFCRAAYVDAELDKRFAAIQAENGLKGLSAEQFADRAGEHISELNAIHPFREGSGRTMRAFLEVLGSRRPRNRY
jgi:cell filamentation protein